MNVVPMEVFIISLLRNGYHDDQIYTMLWSLGTCEDTGEIPLVTLFAAEATAFPVILMFSSRYTIMS